MKTLKAKIKELADLQQVLKNQRKTVTLIGERTIGPVVAFHKHQSNRNELRYMYLAYGIMRGKTQLEVEGHTDYSFDMKYVDKIIKQHTVEVKEDE